MRIGFGFDVHQLSEDREFWLGGIKIPAAKGILGHSDADVLLHAICDAILGALALGDIGKHFPDTDQSFKGIDSKILLSKTIELISQKGYRIGNIDSSVVLQQPKIMPYADDMRKCIAELCQISMDDVSIKATTNEKMGFIGREEGIVAYAVVLLLK
ncbi:MAG: 2-C-methyl-D-erythritol 2,4-cyclodiphosphate synthase [Bacteroidota bacterium]|jgi:2-C-methyl-D-erythritol 2,4-cyclodiphosphate synthase